MNTEDAKPYVPFQDGPSAEDIQAEIARHAALEQEILNDFRGKGHGGKLLYAEDNTVPTPKGFRDQPGDVALSMGFDAARRIVDLVQVKKMTGRDFADLVVRLGYAFEDVLADARNASTTTRADKG